MSRIDELIAELCPEGVEFKPVEELFEMRNGYTPSKANSQLWDEGTVPWFRMDDIRSNGRILDTALKHISEGAVKGGRLFPANSILIATSATIGEHALIRVPHLSNQRFTSLGVRKEFADRLDIKFLFYYCFVLDEWCRHNTTVSSFASVDMPRFRKFQFPLPPMQVQREIVKSLDAFTELEARRKQYEYYRDSLLTFRERERVRWLTLNEFSTNHNSRRKPVTKSHRTPGDIPYYGASGIVDYVSDYLFDGDYLLVSEDGANLLARTTPIAFTASGKSWINNHAHVLEFESEVTHKFVEYYLNSIDLSPFVSTAAQPKLTKQNLNRIPIPVPRAQEQQRKVEILDKFDTLTTDLSIGLPAELAARRKQYEYYRDKLLTFDEKVAA